MQRILCKYQVDLHDGSLHGLFITTSDGLEYSWDMRRGYYSVLGKHREFYVEPIGKYVSVLTENQEVIDLIEEVCQDINTQTKVARHLEDYLPGVTDTTLIGYNPVNGDQSGDDLLNRILINAQSAQLDDWDTIPEQSVVLCVFSEWFVHGLVQSIFITTKRNVCTLYSWSHNCQLGYAYVNADFDNVQILTDDIEKIKCIYNALKGGLQIKHSYLGVSLYGEDLIGRMDTGDCHLYPHEFECFEPVRHCFSI